MVHQLRQQSGDSGAIAVITALFAVMVMLLGALVVEVGSQREARTSAQAAADAAALAAAAAAYAIPAPANPEDAAYQAATTYAQKNWATDRPADDRYWTGCGVDYALTRQSGEVWVPSVNTPCVAFLKDSGGKIVKVQVVVPGEPTAEFFGAVKGNTRALAQAGIEQRIQSWPVLFAGSDTCADALSGSMSEITVDGAVHSNNDIKLLGSGLVNVITGETTYEGNLQSQNVVFNPAAEGNSGHQEYPVSFDIADYAPGGARALADPTHYYAAPSGVSIDRKWLSDNGYLDKNIIREGIYYTDADINLDAGWISGGRGTTFVSAGGRIATNSGRLTPYVDRLTFFTTFKASLNAQGCPNGQPGVKVTSSSLSFEGIILAPSSAIDFSPSNLTSFAGSIIGLTVKFGANNVVLRQIDPVVLGPPAIRLVR